MSIRERITVVKYRHTPHLVPNGTRALYFIWYSTGTKWASHQNQACYFFSKK